MALNLQQSGIGIISDKKTTPQFMGKIKIAVIGLGYVGLPLARLFSTRYKTIGFDVNAARVKALMEGHDYA